MTLRPRLDALIRAASLEVDDDARARLCGWLEAAHLWNKKLDLTAATAPAALVEVLALDALVLSTHGDIPSGARVVDVGTGAGTPGLGLALLRPDLGRVLLVEPLAKRAAFLRTVIGEARAEDRIRVVSDKIDPEHPVVPAAGGFFDAGPPTLAISRATFPPPIWARVGLTLAPEALLMLVDELPELPEGAKVVSDRSYRLPSSGAPRRLVRIAR